MFPGMILSACGIDWFTLILILTWIFYGEPSRMTSPRCFKFWNCTFLRPSVAPVDTDYFSLSAAST